VMSCDLLGSMALPSRLDPEDLREITVAFHRAVADVVAGFDGFVGKHIGDGALVYFGYPILQIGRHQKRLGTVKRNVGRHHQILPYSPQQVNPTGC